MTFFISLLIVLFCLFVLPVLVGKALKKWVHVRK